MSSYAAPKDRSPDELRIALGNLVRNFDNDAATSRSRIRDLFESDRESFFTTSIEILKSAGDTRGGQQLVSLLVSNGMLMRALCNPDLSRDEALALGRAARRVDPMIEVVLARSLVESPGASSLTPGGVQGTDPVKIMDVLCELADSGRIMPYLMRMMRHPNPHLRTKAIKMIGRGSLSAKWVMGKLSDSDPMVRANAIESMWGMDTPEARALLSFAANDGNPRVLANSLLGQYYLGEASALTDLIKLASNESAAFRASAAWVMGETGDPRFSEALRQLISDPSVRKRAFAALGQLKAANAQPPAGESWHLAGRILAGENAKGLRRVMLAVAGEDMREQPKVAPLHFLLNEGGQYITSYKVTERPLPEAISVAFVVPRSREAADGRFFEGLMSCLKWKRPGDFWCILPYIENADGAPPPPRDTDPPEFTNHAAALAAALNGTPKRLDCTDLWTGISRSISPDSGQSRGRRYTIVFSSAEESLGATHSLMDSVLKGRISIQAVSCGPNSQLEEFCSETRSPFKCSTPEELVGAIEQAYLNLLVRFEVAYQPVVADAPTLKVRVQNAFGWCEALIGE